MKRRIAFYIRGIHIEETRFVVIVFVALFLFDSTCCTLARIWKNSREKTINDIRMSIFCSDV